MTWKDWVYSTYCNNSSDFYIDGSTDWYVMYNGSEIEDENGTSQNNSTMIKNIMNYKQRKPSHSGGIVP